MTNIEKLVEAIENCNEEDWWEALGGIKKARHLLVSAARETPDEYQVIVLTEYLDLDPYNNISFGIFTECIKRLKKELADIES